jgi:hypothetical protein
MHPQKVTHLGVDYDLGHLRQTITVFGWTHAKEKMQLSVRVRYSDHCYSREHYGQKEPEGSYIITTGKWPRLFCPIRHDHSLCLPSLFGDIFKKPTEQVRLTAEDNWSIFRLQMPSPMQPGERYSIFFRAKPHSVAADGTYYVDVYIESAYPRDKPVVTSRRLPFGTLIAETALLSK